MALIVAHDHQHGVGRRPGASLRDQVQHVHARRPRGGRRDRRSCGPVPAVDHAACRCVAHAGCVLAGTSWIDAELARAEPAVVAGAQDLQVVRAARGRLTLSSTRSPRFTLCAVANPSMPAGFVDPSTVLAARQFSATIGFEDAHEPTDACAKRSRASPPPGPRRSTCVPAATPCRRTSWRPADRRAVQRERSGRCPAQDAGTRRTVALPGKVDAPGERRGGHAAGRCCLRDGGRAERDAHRHHDRHEDASHDHASLRSGAGAAHTCAQAHPLQPTFG